MIACATYTQERPKYSVKIFCIEFSSPENYHWKEALEGSLKRAVERSFSILHGTKWILGYSWENKEFKAEVFGKHAMYQNIAGSIWKEVVMLIRNNSLRTQRRYLQTQRCARKIMLLKQRVQAMRRHLRKKFKIRGGGTSLAVQWLRLHTSAAVGTGSIPGRGTKIPLPWGMAKKQQQQKRCGTISKYLLLWRSGNSESKFPPGFGVG